MTDSKSFDSAWREKFVRPYYLQLLGGNFTRANEPEASGFRRTVTKAAGVISDDEIARLLIEREWRGRLSAAWFVGLTNRASFVPSIAKLLLASEVAYAGQGYCVALGLMGGEQCLCVLRDYLRTYLPLNGRVYDQAWAIGALAHLENAEPAEFLDRELWRNGDYVMDPDKGIEGFRRIIRYLRQHRMIDAAN